MTKLLARYAKFIAAILGAVTEAVNIGLVPHQAQSYVSVIVSIATALGVVGVPNGPSPDVVGALNDVASFKAQLGPLPEKGGWEAISKWLADQAEHHGQNLEAIAANLEEHLKALVHGAPLVSADPPSTTTGTLTPAPEPVAEPVPADVPEPVSEAPTPVAEPEDPEFTKLKQLIGQ